MVQLTNDPTEFIALVRAARSAAELKALQRPGDLRRERMIGKHARAAAIDETFAKHVVESSVTLALALLDNEELLLIEPDHLVTLVLTAIEGWDDGGDRATAYALAHDPVTNRETPGHALPGRRSSTRAATADRATGRGRFPRRSWRSRCRRSRASIR